MTSWFDINEWLPPAMRRRQRVPDLGRGQPIVELLSAVGDELTGREVVYEGSGRVASGVVEHVELVDTGLAWGLVVPPSSVAAEVRGEIRDPRWGDHHADRLVFRAHDVELTQGVIPELSVGRFELTVELSVAILRRWLDGLDARVDLVGVEDGLVVFRWRRWPVQMATVAGEPHASGRRLCARVKEVRVPGARVDLGSGLELHVAIPLGDMAPSARLTGARVTDDGLAVTAEVRHVRTPVGPEQIMAALRQDKGRVTLREPR